MSKAVEFLRRMEWGAGNGQCPECCGVHGGWLGHPCHPSPESIGHLDTCAIAEALLEGGDSPVFMGKYEPYGKTYDGLKTLKVVVSWSFSGIDALTEVVFRRYAGTCRETIEEGFPLPGKQKGAWIPMMANVISPFRVPIAEQSLYDWLEDHKEAINNQLLDIKETKSTRSGA